MAESESETHRELMSEVKSSDDFLRELGHLLPGEEVKFSIPNVKLRVLGSTSFLKENENEILLYITNYQIVFLERKNSKVEFRTLKAEKKSKRKEEQQSLAKSRSFSGDLSLRFRGRDHTLKTQPDLKHDPKRKTSKLTEEIVPEKKPKRDSKPNEEEYNNNNNNNNNNKEGSTEELPRKPSKKHREDDDRGEKEEAGRRASGGSKREKLSKTEKIEKIEKTENSESDRQEGECALNASKKHSNKHHHKDNKTTAAKEEKEVVIMKEEEKEEKKEEKTTVTLIGDEAEGKKKRKKKEKASEQSEEPKEENGDVTPVNPNDHHDDDDDHHDHPPPHLSKMDKRVILTYPLGKIFRIKEKKQYNGVEIQTKDGVALMVYFTDKHILQQTLLLISKYAFPSSSYQMFCYVHKAVLDSLSLPFFDLENEFKRILANSRAKKDVVISRINQEYEICDTYPPLLLLPASATEGDIKEVARYRSRGRLPTIVWIHPKKKAWLVRSSQPCVGINRNRSTTDEKYLFSLRNERQVKLFIVDSRPRKNAVANMLRGGGFENIKNYKDCEIEFHNIENIHVIRHSLIDLFQLCNNITSSHDLSLLTSIKQEGEEGESVMQQIISEMKNELLLSMDIQKDIEQIEAALEQTKWLFHIRLILESSIRVASLIHSHGQSVLVHCSDGWDRTSQTVATAEMLMDPYYRTVEGFLVMVEKEWMQFGHQFALRYGHGDGNFKESQRSPIFPQWLDVVYQLLVLFPSHFEFTDDLLIVLLDELYSCRFGSFLFDSLKQRSDHSVPDTTAQLWSHLVEHKALYLNPLYKPRKRPIIPDISSVRLQLWSKLYLRMKSPPIRKFVIFERRVAEKEENGEGDTFKKKRGANQEIGGHKSTNAHRKESDLELEEDRKDIHKFVSSLPPGARVSRSLVHGNDEEKKRNTLKLKATSSKKEGPVIPRQRSHTSNTRKH